MNSSDSIQRGAVREVASIRNTHTVTSVAILAAISFALAFTAGLVYYQRSGNAWLACGLGSLAMAVTAALTNYFILLPLFEGFMPLDALIASFAEFIPFICTKLDVVLWNAVPFNLLKGSGISLVTMLAFPKLTPILCGRAR